MSAHSDAFTKACDLLHEHFGTFLIVATISPTENPDPKEDDHTIYWESRRGPIACEGMIGYIKTQLITRETARAIRAEDT